MLGFWRVVLVTGIPLDIVSDIYALAERNLLKTFISPAGNFCFHGKGLYYCNSYLWKFWHDENKLSSNVVMFPEERPGGIHGEEATNNRIMAKWRRIWNFLDAQLM